MFAIREAQPSDYAELMALYREHLAKVPARSEEPWRDPQETFQRIASSPDYHLLVGLEDGRIVSSVTVIVIPNLTHGGRPYSIIENVVTHGEFRGRGYATALMGHAARIAEEAGCYKIMLMTGSREESTLRFYEQCGFNRQDKTGFIRWLPQTAHKQDSP